MTYSFARVSAAVAMDVEDYHPQGKRWWIRLHEKGGKRHEMPAHHNLEAYLDAYIEVAGIRDDKKDRRTGALTDNRMNRVDVWRMVQRRAAAAGLIVHVGNHSFRATGITAYLNAGGTLENAQAMAAHESPRTTKLYDRTGDEITLDEVEWIAISVRLQWRRSISTPSRVGHFTPHPNMMSASMVTAPFVSMFSERMRWTSSRTVRRASAGRFA
jgi:integrase/recombinase XerD